MTPTWAIDMHNLCNVVCFICFCNSLLVYYYTIFCFSCQPLFVFFDKTRSTTYYIVFLFSRQLKYAVIMWYFYNELT